MQHHSHHHPPTQITLLLHKQHQNHNWGREQVFNGIADYQRNWTTQRLRQEKIIVSRNFLNRELVLLESYNRIFAFNIQKKCICQIKMMVGVKSWVEKYLLFIKTTSYNITSKIFVFLARLFFCNFAFEFLNLFGICSLLRYASRIVINLFDNFEYLLVFNWGNFIKSLKQDKDVWEMSPIRKTILGISFLGNGYCPIIIDLDEERIKKFVKW